jgi:hypothetical protein
MLIAIIHPVTKHQITLPEGCPCPRVGELVSLRGGEEVYTVIHDYLCNVVWVEV